MKVALLTMFNGLGNTYSLVNVVEEHLTMLLGAGIPVKILVSENCPDEQRTGIFLDERLEWIKITNSLDGELIHWHDYSSPTASIHGTFFQEADVIAADYERHLADVDVCIMHDIHYQGWHLVHNAAIRKAQKNLPHTRFIAFTHSAPVNPPLKAEWPLSARYTPMDKTVYAYPTVTGLPSLAKQYKVAEGRCRPVNNSVDLLKFLEPEVKELSKKTDLLSPDILIVYPARLTGGKKFEKVASLAGALKTSAEKTVKVIFCDFPSMDIPPEQYKRIIRMEGEAAGLEEEDVIFTSDMGYEHGFPRKAVLDLFTLSNLFVCPSYSESFGLTVLEASSRGNMIVVNEAVPALEELGKNINAYFMRWDARNFGFDTTENYYPNERAYLTEHAVKIAGQMRENAVLHAKTMVRKRYSPDWIWENHLKPLLEY